MCGCFGERDGFREAFERERLALGDAQHFISSALQDGCTDTERDAVRAYVRREWLASQAEFAQRLNETLAAKAAFHTIIAHECERVRRLATRFDGPL